ncbi:hypothetical protein [Thalassobacillus pellis]|uniref:hypothetical protein n=1 Tax=Thalassobacillus pellis TaxID=748008 RepID=UPI0019607595|nr:hypothetical protein [Thalassobacillus pellis]MBM7551661.1 hypothetical protein [Thalassobacillus pellis]
MTKEVLVITTRPLEVNVSSSIRKLSTINALVDAGANVSVLTAVTPNKSSNFNNTIDYSNITKVTIDAGKMYNSGVRKTTDKTTQNLKRKTKSIGRKIYYKTQIYDPLKGCIKKINKLEGKLKPYYDKVISISDPKSSHLLTNTLIKEKIISYGEYIQIWGDPMYLDITNKSLIPGTFIKKEEKRLLSRADKILYVSPLTLKEEKKIFPKYANRMDLLFPTYQKETIYQKVNKITKIGYFGDYNSNIRNIKPLYNAIKNTPYELEIYGNSDLDLASFDNVRVNRRVSFQKVKELEKDVDLLVHLSNSSGTQIPGKIYQYMGTNKPILFILDGDKETLKETFNSFNRVLFCYNSESDILNKLKRFNNGEISVSNKPVREFHYKNIASKILGNGLDV